MFMCKCIEVYFLCVEDMTIEEVATSTLEKMMEEVSGGGASGGTTIDTKGALSDNQVDTDIMPNVYGNVVHINVCSCSLMCSFYWPDS